MYQNDAQKCLTGECRLSYCHLDQPYAKDPKKREPKYSVTLLIPKTDIATKADLDNAVRAAYEDGVNKAWKGQRPPNPPIPIWDGDGVRKNGDPFGPECKGHWVMTASSKNRPQVVHQSNVRVELMPTDIYSGMYGRVTVRLFAFDQEGSRGIGCGLGNVMKTRDGESLAGGSTAEEDFASLEQTASPAYPGYPQTTNPAQTVYPAQGYQQPAYQPPAAQPAYQPYQQPYQAQQPIQGQPQYSAQQPTYGTAPGQINPATGQINQ